MEIFMVLPKLSLLSRLWIKKKVHMKNAGMKKNAKNVKRTRQIPKLHYMNTHNSDPRLL